MPWDARQLADAERRASHYAAGPSSRWPGCAYPSTHRRPAAAALHRRCTDARRCATTAAAPVTAPSTGQAPRINGGRQAHLQLQHTELVADEQQLLPMGVQLHHGVACQCEPCTEEQQGGLQQLPDMGMYDPQQAAFDPPGSQWRPQQQRRRLPADLVAADDVAGHSSLEQLLHQEQLDATAWHVNGAAAVAAGVHVLEHAPAVSSNQAMPALQPPSTAPEAASGELGAGSTAVQQQQQQQQRKPRRQQKKQQQAPQHPQGPDSDVLSSTRDAGHGSSRRRRRRSKAEASVQEAHSSSSSSSSSSPTSRVRSDSTKELVSKEQQQQQQQQQQPPTPQPQKRQRQLSGRGEAYLLWEQQHQQQQAAASGRMSSSGADPQQEEEVDAEQQELLRQQVSLTRQIMAASSWQGLRALLDQQGGHLNHVHLIAMISRLDALQVEQRQQQQQAQGPAPLPQHSPLQQQQQQTPLQQQQQQQFLASGWVSPRERVQRNKLVAWLFGTAGRVLPLLGGRELPVLLAGAARLGANPGKPWVICVMTRCYHCMRDFTPEGLATTVWALGQLGIQLKGGPKRQGPGAAWVRRCMGQYEAWMAQGAASSRALSVLLLGLARVGCWPQPEWLEAWQGAMLAAQAGWSSQDVTCALTALASLKAQGGSTTGRLRWSPSYQLLQQFGAHLCHPSRATNDVELVNSLAALAQLTAAEQPAAGTGQQHTRQHAPQQPQQPGQQEGAHQVQLLQPLLQVAAQQLARLSGKRVVTLLYALARWRVPAAAQPRGWRQQSLSALEQQLWQLDEQGLSNLLYALAHLSWQVPPAFRQAYTAALARAAPGMGPQAWAMVDASQRLAGWPTNEELQLSYHQQQQQQQQQAMQGQGHAYSQAPPAAALQQPQALIPVQLQQQPQQQRKAPQRVVRQQLPPVTPAKRQQQQQAAAAPARAPALRVTQPRPAAAAVPVVPAVHVSVQTQKVQHAEEHVAGAADLTRASHQAATSADAPRTVDAAVPAAAPMAAAAAAAVPADPLVKGSEAAPPPAAPRQCERDTSATTQQALQQLQLEQVQPQQVEAPQPEQQQQQQQQQEQHLLALEEQEEPAPHPGLQRRSQPRVQQQRKGPRQLQGLAVVQAQTRVERSIVTFPARSLLSRPLKKH